MDPDKLDSMRNTKDFLELLAIPWRKLFVIGDLSLQLWLDRLLRKQSWFEADRVMHESVVSPTDHLFGILREADKLAITGCLSDICEVLPRERAESLPILADFFVFSFILNYSTVADAAETLFALWLAYKQIR